MRIALFALLLAGCWRQDPLFCEKHPDMCTDGGVPIDRPEIDAPVRTYGSGDYAVTVGAGGAISFSDTTIMTSTGNPCLPASIWVNNTQPDACFVVGGTIMLSNVKVTGTRPIVFVAAETITINGILDVSSHNMAGIPSFGPGVFEVAAGACLGMQAGSDAQGGGGAGGGSFMTNGGDGGTGKDATIAKGTAAPAAGADPMLLRTGCSGQVGGDGNGTGTGGKGGGGGGAVYLVAGMSMDLSSAVINASGAGGFTGANRAGGGGGGAGGMIVLFATTISSGSSTKLVANGGGGAGGQMGGGNGSDPDPSAPGTAAPRGIAGNCGQNGGGPGGVDMLPGEQGGNGCTGSGGGGGGGGGGGVGYIQTNKPLSGTFSPNPILK